MNKGYVVQVIGPVVDVKFENATLPSINTALKIKVNSIVTSASNHLTLEVAMHIGDHTVRCIAMDATEGIIRGMEVEDTGLPILVPVGRETLGRIFNVLGETIDGKEKLTDDVKKMPIHKEAPKLSELSGKMDFRNWYKSY